MILIICKKYFTQILFYYLMGECGVIIYKSCLLTKKAYSKTAGFGIGFLYGCVAVLTALSFTEN